MDGVPLFSEVASAPPEWLYEPENVRSGVVVKCLNGGVITGVPKRGNLPNGWRVRIVNGNLALTSNGTHIILR